MVVADHIGKLKTRREAAEMLSLAEQTLAKWAMTGEHLPVIKCGRAVRYRESDILGFIEKNTMPASN